MPKVGTIPTLALKASTCTDAARGALDRSDLRLAQRALDVGLVCAEREKNAGDSMAKIAALRKMLETAQDRLLAAAEKNAATGKHFEALKQYHTFVRKYAGLRIATVAATKIAEAREDPDLRVVDKRAESEAPYDDVDAMLDAMWKTKLTAASGAKPTRPADADLVAAALREKQIAILKLLATVRTAHPGTTADTKAAALDEAIRANKPLIQAIEKSQADQVARGLFLQASFYESAKAKDKAAIVYRQLVEKYPTSTYAITARRKLKLLPG